MNKRFVILNCQVPLWRAKPVCEARGCPKGGGCSSIHSLITSKTPAICRLISSSVLSQLSRKRLESGIIGISHNAIIFYIVTLLAIVLGLTTPAQGAPPCCAIGLRPPKGDYPNFSAIIRIAGYFDSLTHL